MGTSWGLGFERFDTPSGAIIGHDGGTIGQSAFLRMVPEAGVAVALLTNGGDTISLYRDVVGHVLERAHRAPAPGAARAAGGPGAHRRQPVRRHLLRRGRRPDRQPGRRRPDLAGADPEGALRGARREAGAQGARPLPRRQPDPRSSPTTACTCRTPSSATTATATPSTCTSAAPSGAPEPDPPQATQSPREQGTAHEADTAALGVCAAAALLAACGGGATATLRHNSDSNSRGEVAASTSTAARSPWRSRATRASSTRSPPPAASCSPSTSSRYDNLVSVDAETGEIQSQLATEWKVDGTTVTLTLARGHHLRRRQRLHRDDRRRQHRLRRRPEEQEPLPRHVPAGRRDREGRRRRRHGDDHAGAARAVRAQRPRQPADGLRGRA